MNMQHTLQQLFNKSSLAEVSLPAIKEIVRKHPYFATGHLLLAKKLQLQGDSSWPQQLQKTALYFNDPLLLEHLFHEMQTSFLDPAPASVPEAETAAAGTRAIPAPVIVTIGPMADDLPIFEPYHTIDYFASQGIKLSQDIRPDDKLGKQLKSFTEWLKTLRRLPEPGSVEENANMAERAEQQHYPEIEEIAAHSLEEKDVLTEAMAEVLLRQGKKRKAIEVYNKLSLLNPDKKAYFADRIKELNEL